MPLYYLGGFSSAEQQAFQVTNRTRIARAEPSSRANPTAISPQPDRLLPQLRHPRQALTQPVGVVLPAALLNGTVLAYLATHAPRLTAGVIVLEDEPGLEEDARMAAGAFSPDVTTPQGQGTPSAALTMGPAHAWNAHGNGIALQEYAFPVVLATGKEGHT